MLPKPCLECGDLTEGSRCPECEPEFTRARRALYETDRPNSRERGYDTAWTRLSQRARALQTYCSDAHLSPCSGPLTTDHLRWPARSLADVDVVCLTHNNRRGSSRPGTKRATA